MIQHHDVGLILTGDKDFQEAGLDQKGAVVIGIKMLSMVGNL